MRYAQNGMYLKPRINLEELPNQKSQWQPDGCRVEVRSCKQNTCLVTMTYIVTSVSN